MSMENPRERSNICDVVVENRDSSRIRGKTMWANEFEVLTEDTLSLIVVLSTSLSSVQSHCIH